MPKNARTPRPAAIGASRVTMADVATAAKVSVMTVSRALRDDARLTPTTRLRVQATAQRLGYAPDPAVSALMARLRSSRQRSPETIAWLHPRPMQPDWPDGASTREFYEGAAGRAAQLGYKLELVAGLDEGLSAARLTRILVTRGIAGVLLAPLPGVPEPVSLDWSRFAAATYGYTVSFPALHRACNHHVRIVRRALTEVMGRGYQRPGLMISRLDNARVDDGWTAGFLAFQSHLPPARRVPPLLYDDIHRCDVAGWLKRHRPDVVIGHSVDSLWAITATRRKVPADLGFVLLDLHRQTAPCAGMRQRHAVVGATAVDLVVAQLYRNERGIPSVPKLVLVEGEWVDGPTLER